MNQVTVGILGGMGPRATVIFEQRLLDAFEGSDQDLPRIISVNDGSIPDRTKFLESNGPDPLIALLRSAGILMDAGADIICLPCNTAHASRILGRLQERLPLPVIDMPAAALMQAEELQVQSLLVMATRGTGLARVYQSQGGEIICQFPAAAEQNSIDTAIELIKHGQPDRVDTKRLNKIIKNSGCDAAVLACTELSLLQTRLASPGVMIIDAMDCLVRCCIERVSSYTKRQGAIS